MTDLTSPSFPHGVEGEMRAFRAREASRGLDTPLDSASEGTQMQPNTAPMICIPCDTEYPEGQTWCDWCGRKTAPVSHLARDMEETCDRMTNDIHAKAYSPWTVHVQNYNPQPPLYHPSRYDGTICDPGLTHYQQKMARLRSIARTIALTLAVASWVIGASILVMSAIYQSGSGQ